MAKKKRIALVTVILIALFYQFRVLNFGEIRQTPAHKEDKKETSSPYFVDVYARVLKEPSQMDWITVQRADMSLFIYSAFYDDRKMKGTDNVHHVAVIGKWEKVREQPIFCAFWNNIGSLLHVSMATYIYSPYFAYRTIVIQCPLTIESNDQPIPKFVSIDTDLKLVQSHDARKIPVEVPAKPDKKKEFVICLKAFYQIPGLTVEIGDVKKIVEWVEMNKLLGVEHIYVYNNSMGRDISQVFKYYAKKGFADIFTQGLLPIKDPVHSGTQFASFTINDCLYRLMHTAKKILYIDIDEMIVGFGFNKLTELLQHVADVEHVPVNNTNFSFRNQRYFLDDPLVKKSAGGLVTQYAVRHVEAEPWPLHPKTIIDPATCLLATAHYCHTKTKGYRLIQVSSDIAASLHYKTCQHSRAENKPNNCTEAFMHSVEDLSMRKYGKQLEQNVNMVISDILKV